MDVEYSGNSAKSTVNNNVPRVWGKEKPGPSAELKSRRLALGMYVVVHIYIPTYLLCRVQYLCIYV